MIPTNNPIMTIDALRFPNCIAEIRRRERLKLAELARIVGVSRRHLTDIEAGRKIPNAALLHDLAEALKSAMNELLEPDWLAERCARIRDATLHDQRT